MLTVALLALFTILCVLLSADRAWDNVTKPERNELVFDGRHRAYGAFVLRREYDRRFVWAFLGALGFLGAVVAVPKAMAALGIQTPAVPKELVGPWITVDFEDEPVEIPKSKPETQPEKPKPSDSSGGPVIPATPTAPVVPVDTLPTQGPEPGPDPTPVGPGGDPAPKTPLPGTGGDTPGNKLGTSANPMSAAEVKDMPKFPGGDEAMVKFVQEHIRLPEFDEGGKKKEWVEFVVDENGNVVRVRSKRRADRAFSEAAEQVVRSMPKWTPAVLENGDKVACWLVLPIQVETR